MTQEGAKKHWRELKRWAEAPNGTEMWHKTENEKWVLSLFISGSDDSEYIVDDEWAELRKAQADGKQLQYLHGSVWTDCELRYVDMKTSKASEWRIKPEVEFPIYRRHRRNGYIYKFYSEKSGRIMMSDSWKTTRELDANLMSCFDTCIWEEVETFEHGGEIYYDTQPVWCWGEKDTTARVFSFIDAKNGGVFDSRGHRVGIRWQHYAHIDWLEKWMLQAWAKLKYKED